MTETIIYIIVHYKTKDEKNLAKFSAKADIIITMDTNAVRKIRRKTYIMFPLAFLLMVGIFMVTAGSINYWQGWVFCIEIFIIAFFVTAYFLKRSPEFLDRRMKFKEKEVEQKKIIKISNVLFFFGMLIPGFDHRFGWSNVPFWLVIFSDVMIFAAYYLVFLAFKENAFAGRTVEIFKGQKVIDTGPYAVVRHPMYAGIIPIFIFMPLALGSFWAVIPFTITALTIVIFRIINEEKVLRRGLPDYNEYCKKVHYRLIPFVW